MALSIPACPADCVPCRASSAVPMAHRVPVGTMTGRERFQLRARLGGSGEARHLAERLARYGGPSCGGCGLHGAVVKLELVTVAGGVWRLCPACRAELGRWRDPPELTWRERCEAAGLVVDESGL